MNKDLEKIISKVRRHGVLEDSIEYAMDLKAVETDNYVLVTRLSWMNNHRMRRLERGIDYILRTQVYDKRTEKIRDLETQQYNVQKTTFYKYNDSITRQAELFDYEKLSEFRKKGKDRYEIDWKKDGDKKDVYSTLTIRLHENKQGYDGKVKIKMIKPGLENLTLSSASDRNNSDDYGYTDEEIEAIQRSMDNGKYFL